jgi:protein SCO1/2
MKFSEVYKGLKSLGPSVATPHLLTVSFDPEHDKPAVLREYAGRFMRPLDFAQWEFATGSEDQIKEITGYFGLTYRPESGQITHNLVTALIGPDGKLKKLFQGKDWTPTQVLADFR